MNWKLEYLNLFLWRCGDCFSFPFNSQGSLKSINILFPSNSIYIPIFGYSTCWSTMVCSLRGVLEKITVGTHMLPLASCVTWLSTVNPKT